jgi:ribosomal protein L30E
MERKVKLVFISKTLPEKIENNIEQQTTFMQVKKFNKFNLFGK